MQPDILVFTSYQQVRGGQNQTPLAPAGPPSPNSSLFSPTLFIEALDKAATGQVLILIFKMQA